MKKFIPKKTAIGTGEPALNLCGPMDAFLFAAHYVTRGHTPLAVVTYPSAQLELNFQKIVFALLKKT